MSTSKILVVVILLSSFSLSNAAVLERDLLEPGDGLLTYDDINQREWLDLPYSYNDISVILSQMVPSGFLEGFSFATMEDVEQLMSSAEVSQVEEIRLPGVNGRGPKKLIDLMGFMFHAEGGLLGELQYTFGQVAVDFYGAEPVFENKNVAVFSVGKGDIMPGVITRTPGAVGTSGGYFSSPPLELLTGEFAGIDDLGPFWLYRNVIPEPGTLSLLFILGLTTLLRRKLPE